MKSFLNLILIGASWVTFAQENLLAQSGVVRFADVVQAHFEQWDSNGDGVLSKEEIERVAANPKTKGEEAAAIATLVHFTRNSKLALAPFTKEFLTQKTANEPASSDSQSGLAEDDNVAKTKTLDFQKRFHRNLQKINHTSRELFPQKLPSFDAVHQGNIGDCPFVSTVGALVYRSPTTVRSMFVENEKGGIGVTFGNGHKMNINNLTDVDIAMWSSAGTNGLWLTILEKAYRRELVAIEHPEAKERPSIYDKFGSSKLTIEILDGYKTEHIALNRFKTGSQDLDLLRNRLMKAFHEQRIVKAGTSKNVQIPGITPDHAYAILGFSKDQDAVQVWNPHGQEFTPEGSQGLESGYETKRGTFFVPLRAFT